MSAYVVFAHILWRRRVIRGSIGGRVPGESHAPRPGKAVYEITAVQPCSRERLVDVPAFAAHGFGDFRSHPFFTQGDDAGTVESGET